MFQLNKTERQLPPEIARQGGSIHLAQFLSQHERTAALNFLKQIHLRAGLNIRERHREVAMFTFGEIVFPQKSGQPVKS